MEGRSEKKIRRHGIRSDLEITKADWEENKFNNEILIKTNLMQIKMAKQIIKLCEREIKKFPVEEKKDEPVKKIATGVG